MQKFKFILVLIFSFFCFVGCANKPAEEVIIEDAVYVSVNGIGDGSYESPCSLDYALEHMTTEKPVYLLGGTYSIENSIVFSKNATASKKYVIAGWHNQNVVLDFGYHQGQTPKYNNVSTNIRYSGITISGNYYKIANLTITGAGCCGMYVCGHYNLIENCVFKENGNSGLQISGSSGDTIANWPHDNTIKNCTSFGNYDWNRSDGKKGEDADGFACKICAGENNVFDGCIAYNNSDDGWDLFTKRTTGVIGSVTIKNSIAFRNGYGMNGTALKNGNGFKLGGRALEVNHTVENCLAFNNKGNGFDDNSNPGTLTFVNCTAYNNEAKNFATGRFVEENNTYDSTWTEDGVSYGPIENVPKSHNVYSSCLSYKDSGDNKDYYVGNAEYCLFFYSANKYVSYGANGACTHKTQANIVQNTDIPFISISNNNLNNLQTIHSTFRDSNHNIKLGNFLKANFWAAAYGSNGRIGCYFE